MFPTSFDYVALGHYHIPSVIQDHIRYCGSPIPMGFGEAKQTKCVFIIDFTTGRGIEKIVIPTFQRLESIAGSKSDIETRLHELKKIDESVWIEIIYQGDELFPDLIPWINELVVDSKLEVLKVQNKQQNQEVLSQQDVSVSLDELNPYDVFTIFLEKSTISENQKEDLTIIYKEVIDSITLKD
jgi:exonuclease SbcD